MIQPLIQFPSVRIKNTDGSVRRRFSSGFCHKKCLLRSYSVNPECATSMTLSVIVIFQLRNIFSTKIKLKTDGEVNLSHHLSRQLKLKSCTLIFRRIRSVTNSTVHYLQVIVFNVSITDKKTVVQSKSPQYSLFQPTVQRKCIHNSDSMIYPDALLGIQFSQTQLLSSILLYFSRPKFKLQLQLSEIADHQGCVPELSFSSTVNANKVVTQN